MNKFTLFKLILVFFIMLLLLVGLIFFRKENPKEESKIEINTEESINEVSEEELQKEKIQTNAENFIRSYYSYNWGNFSNIESQYPLMTEELKKIEEDKVIKIKEEIENQPKKYLSAKANIIRSDILECNDNKAKIILETEIENIAGAMTDLSTYVLVDENGEIYEGSYKDLVTSTEIKTIELEFIKTEEGWKVNKIY